MFARIGVMQALQSMSRRLPLTRAGNALRPSGSFDNKAASFRSSDSRVAASKPQLVPVLEALTASIRFAAHAADIFAKKGRPFCCPLAEGNPPLSTMLIVDNHRRR
jgi:hypothetical protein